MITSLLPIRGGHPPKKAREIGLDFLKIRGNLVIYYNQKELGNRIQKVRKQDGLKQADLAEEMNISREMLSRIENGKNSCAPDQLMFLCQRFNKPADYYYFGINANI